VGHRYLNGPQWLGSQLADIDAYGCSYESHCVVEASAAADKL